MVRSYVGSLKLAKPFRSGKECFVPAVKRYNCGHITVPLQSQLAAEVGPGRRFSNFRISKQLMPSLSTTNVYQLCQFPHKLPQAMTLTHCVKLKGQKKQNLRY